jgi:hypothetical protein
MPKSGLASEAHGVIKLSVTPLADPQQVSHALVKDTLIRQMGALFAIPTQAYLALIFSTHLDCWSQQEASRAVPKDRLSVVVDVVSRTDIRLK